MKKPVYPPELSKPYRIPEDIRVDLALERYILDTPIHQFIEPAALINTIPLNILYLIKPTDLYNDLRSSLYALSQYQDNDVDLSLIAKSYLNQVYQYFTQTSFKNRLFNKFNLALKENEAYINNLRIKAAKARTAAEADLLGVDMVYHAIKRYRGEVLQDVGSQMEQGESSTSPIQPLSVFPPATSVLAEKSNKKYSLNPSFSCLHAHHKPKIQTVDRQSITTLCELGIESLSQDVNYIDTDAMAEFRRNCENQQVNHSLSQFDGIKEFLADVMQYDFDSFVSSLWTHKIHRSTDAKTKHMACIISYALTDFHCNCRQSFSIETNHERTPFVEYVVPIFKYLAKETDLITFAWCEKLVESQKHTHIAEVDFESSEVDKKYADGLGNVDDCETLFIESSNGSQHENIAYTLEDTLKLIIKCNGALCYILSQLKKCNFESALKKSTFGIQVIKDTLTISHMQLKENLKCKFVELRSAQVPSDWNNRYNWVKMFELVATLYLRLIRESGITADMKKEHVVLISVPREITLSAHLELTPS